MNQPHIIGILCAEGFRKLLAEELCFDGDRSLFRLDFDLASVFLYNKGNIIQEGVVPRINTFSGLLVERRHISIIIVPLGLRGYQCNNKLCIVWNG